MGGASLLETPQPHHIPGYAGHVPQYIYRSGDTYGSVTHKLLLDPSVNHAEKLVLSDRAATDFQVVRPNKNDIDIIEGRFKRKDALYRHPIIPGYGGVLPKIKDQTGQRFTIEATEAVSNFEKYQIKDKLSSNQLRREILAQDDKVHATIEDKINMKSEYKLPMVEVRPEACGILRAVVVEEPKPTPQPNPESPYFMEVNDPNKHFMSGFSGHVPFGQSKYGEGFPQSSNSALNDFSSNVRKNKSTEWAPIALIKPEPPLIICPTEVYPIGLGLIPNYAGHVPGHQFRSGKTFGVDTRDSKRWLRGDFTQ